MTTIPRPRPAITTEEPGDAELITATRNGDSAAFGTLYRRHVAAAHRMARALVADRASADDLVAESFVRLLARLRAGHGPDLAFRAYLLTSLRNTCYRQTRRDRRVTVTDDLSPYDAGTPYDPGDASLVLSPAAKAFRRLPERWRAVLWHTAVQDATPAQVAPLLGLTPNGVSALAYRARGRLRQMYLQEHEPDPEITGACVSGEFVLLRGEPADR